MSPRKAKPREVGHIYERAPGVFRVRLPRGKGPDGRRLPDYSWEFRGDAKGAEEFKRERWKEIETGRTPDNELTLTEFVERRFLPNIARGFTDEGDPYSFKTRERYENALRKHILPRLGSRPLHKITLADLEWLRDEMRATGTLAETTVSDHLAVLSSVFSYAEDHLLVSANPCKRLRGRKRRPAQESPAFSLEAVVSLLQFLLSTRFATAAVLSLAHGLRREEILGLRWSDIDLDQGTIRIRRALIAWAKPGPGREAEPIWKEPKTAGSRRTMKIVEPFIEQLRTERVQQMRARMQLGSAWRGAAHPDDDQVVAMDDGSPWRPSSFTRAWRLLLKENSDHVPYLTIKDARTAWVSISYALGIDPAVIARLAGHSQQVAQSHYLRPLLSSEVAAAAILGESLARSTPRDL